MKRGVTTAFLWLVCIPCLCAAVVRSGGYYPPTFGGYNIDTLTRAGSRTSLDLTLGFKYSRDTSGLPSIKVDGFTQSGGTHDIEGPLIIEGLILLTGVGGRAHTHFYRPYYHLTDGHLNCYDITVSTASFVQSGGTNHVKVELKLDGGSYEDTTSCELSGGRLITFNTVVLPRARFTQVGGVHVVNNLLAVHGNTGYSLRGGKLFVRDILLNGGAIFLHGSRGVIRQSGTLSLAGGRWFAARGLTELGMVQLKSGSSGISLSPFVRTTLRFAQSGGVAWSPDALLIIQGWQAKTNGAPLHRIHFGTDSAGLTPNQLAQIRFRNPYSYPSGDYPARIRRDGEVRPTPSP